MNDLYPILGGFAAYTDPISTEMKTRKKADSRRTAGAIRVASFFSGAGGLDLGFHDAGFKIVFANEIESVFCDTLRSNRGKWLDRDLVVNGDDIRTLRDADLPTDIDFVIGGPPCQSFSASGRRAGGAAGQLDERGTLFRAYQRIIGKLRPRGFLLENVRGIFATNDGRDWRQIKLAFEALGYRISYRVLDACDYGIPQHRERLILVGHKLDEFLFPAPIVGPDSSDNEPYISPREAFKNLAREDDTRSLRLEGGKYSHLLPLVPNGGNYLHFTAMRGYPNPIFAYRSRFSDFLYKAHPDYPIKTLIASPGKYTGPFHWENRRFSIREYKRLQGFPDGYSFSGTRSEIIKQIGNSVSPAMAKYLALAIAKQVFGAPVAVDLMPPGKVLSFDKRKGQTARLTREKHTRLAKARRGSNGHTFSLSSYEARVEPCDLPQGQLNVTARAKAAVVSIVVNGDGSSEPFASLTIEVRNASPDLFTPEAERITAILHVSLFGRDPRFIQTMWNAVDHWVIKSSNYHSLYELYGHFTEPHPVFSITAFETANPHPVAQFAKHAAQFENCSRYFRKSHLTDMFGVAFGTSSFGQLAAILRAFRYDIRCHETNVAIPPDEYMVAYPFTLPHRKQMNFSITTRAKTRHALAEAAP